MGGWKSNFPEPFNRNYTNPPIVVGPTVQQNKHGNDYTEVVSLPKI